MRIIAISTLKNYYLKHSETEIGLKIWIQKTKKSIWKQPSDILQTFTHGRTIGNGRVVFNINKNDYRLIIQVNYDRGTVFICFIGTHSDYDKVDKETVWKY